MTVCEQIRLSAMVCDCFAWLLQGRLATQGLQHASKMCLPMWQWGVTQVCTDFDVVRLFIIIKLWVMLLMHRALLFTFCEMCVHLSIGTWANTWSTYMQHMFACLRIRLHVWFRVSIRLLKAVSYGRCKHALLHENILWVDLYVLYCSIMCYRSLWYCWGSVVTYTFLGCVTENYRCCRHHNQLSKSCVLNMSCDQFNQSCLVEGKTAWSVYFASWGKIDTPWVMHSASIIGNEKIKTLVLAKETLLTLSGRGCFSFLCQNSWITCGFAQA